MWKLQSRDNKSRAWKELGNMAGITDAAECVLREEENQAGSLFFSVYVDPVIDGLVEKTDAELLCRLEYHGTKAFYLLTRPMQ
jgi:hypothetical protein